MYILNNVKEFHEKLYTCADSDVIISTLKKSLMQKFKPDISSSLEAEISEKEVPEFLKNIEK